MKKNHVSGEFKLHKITIKRFCWKQRKFCSRTQNKESDWLDSHPTETEPLPPELLPLMAADDEGAEVNATDPIVRLFLKRQRRMKEVKKRREAGLLERLDRFAVKKYYTIRRGWVLFSRSCSFTNNINLWIRAVKISYFHHTVITTSLCTKAYKKNNYT